MLYKPSLESVLLKDLLEHFPESQEQQEDKSTLIVFREGMKNMLKEALKKRDFNEDAWILAKAAVFKITDIPYCKRPQLKRSR